jgi:hypothetical protein
MWTRCPLVLDAPVKVLGLETDDCALILVSPIVTGLFVSTWASILWGAGIGVGLYRVKRGKPPGTVLHWLHRMELVRLPGVLGPKPQRYSPW